MGSFQGILAREDDEKTKVVVEGYFQIGVFSGYPGEGRRRKNKAEIRPLYES